VITAFSGGSQAGLLMARQVAGLRADVVSVPIAWTGERVREYVVDVIDRARKRYGLAVEPPQEVRLLDGFQGVGRADVRSEELETVLRLARLEGIIFDPVYTAKAFGGLLETLRRDPRALGRRVCFVHTGGVFSVFPFREPLSRLIDS
jgi:D-cysteine desulfhydrase